MCQNQNTLALGRMICHHLAECTTCLIKGNRWSLSQLVCTLRDWARTRPASGVAHNRWDALINERTRQTSIEVRKRHGLIDLSLELCNATGQEKVIKVGF